MPRGCSIKYNQFMALAGGSLQYHQQFLQHPEDAEAEGKGEGQFI